MNKETSETRTRGNRDLMRAMNRSIVLNLIKTHGPIARAQVARHTGLSPATVSGITAELIEEELVFEKEMGDSSGGRPPILLAINHSGGYVVGLKLAENQITGALTDLEANVLLKRRDPLDAQTVEIVVDRLALMAAELLQEAGLTTNKLLGVGVGLAGIVDSERGLLRQSPYFGWRDLALQELLQHHLHAPVIIDNDVNTLTIAEMLFGAGQHASDFLTITVGRGIGLGIVANGQLYRGAGGGAGEFGHTLVDPDGPPCDCGKRGCLETFVAYPHLLQAAASAYRREEFAQPVASIETLVRLAEEGDSVAHSILSDAGSVLGGAIADLVNMFNPQRIILGGEGTSLGSGFFDPLFAAIRAHALPALFEDVEIRLEPWGDEAWARGAASLVLRQLFASPVQPKARLRVSV